MMKVTPKGLRLTKEDHRTLMLCLGSLLNPIAKQRSEENLTPKVKMKTSGKNHVGWISCEEAL